MPTRAALAPTGQETTTWLLRTGFSETPSDAVVVRTWNTLVESLAKPTASTHQEMPPVAMNRTRAPGAPVAAGRSTRTGYHAGPSPVTAYALLHVAPLSGENCTSPRWAGT